VCLGCCIIFTPSTRVWGPSVSSRVHPQVVSDSKFGIKYPIADLVAGVNKRIPIPYLSLSVPDLGNVGVDAVVNLSGDLSEFLFFSFHVANTHINTDPRRPHEQDTSHTWFLCLYYCLNAFYFLVRGPPGRSHAFTLGMLSMQPSGSRSSWAWTHAAKSCSNPNAGQI
jgi:hypothetical protein